LGIPILVGLVGLAVSLRMRRRPYPQSNVSPESMGFG